MSNGGNIGPVAPQFTQADHQRLIEGLQRIESLDELLEKMERCGDDVSVFRAMAAQMRQKFEARRAEFFTPPPGA